MVYKIADNIISPIGETTEENYEAVKQGKSKLCRYEGKWGLTEPFVASLFDDEQNQSLAIDGLTRFESLVVSTVVKALAGVSADLLNDRTVFILSTTKGNIELLDNAEDGLINSRLDECVKRIARYIGITTEPIVVCNACISGLSAIILAKRLIETGQYDNAIVCGADCQNKFIVSGFQSFKAISDELCRPFDIERVGLNLGEAAATMILSSTAQHDAQWAITSGAVRNDAFHISSPAKKGDGCFMAIEQVMQHVQKDDLAFINAHGTATLYNDQMEAVALKRAELTDVPINAYKGCYGHTMGAAGVLETILSMKAAEDSIVLGTKGFSEIGVSGNLNVSSTNRETDKQTFVKLLSGFGGCNAAIMATMANAENSVNREANYLISHRVQITPEHVLVDGKPIECDGKGKDLVTDLYKRYVGDYPKFYKMDMMCKVGFVASELLLQAEGSERYAECNDRSVILFNKTSSINADRNYQQSISDEENFYPSPSLFVYTLPNIVTGEIAIRNKYHGETAFYVLPRHDDKQMTQILQSSFEDNEINSILGGWLDCDDENHFNVDFYIMNLEN